MPLFAAAAPDRAWILGLIGPLNDPRGIEKGNEAYGRGRAPFFRLARRGRRYNRAW